MSVGRAPRSLLSLPALLAVVACNQTMIQTPSRSLDRPSDVALVCTVRQDDGTPVMAPLSDCKISSEADCVRTASDGTKTYEQGDCKLLGLPIDYRPQQLFGLAATTARGEVALFTTGPTALGAQQLDLSNRPVFEISTGRPIRILDSRVAAIVDINPSTPGFGFLPVGGGPDHIRASVDGCRAVTANINTCDLAVIDVYALIRKAADPGRRGSFPDDVVTRLPIRAKGGAPLFARPTWIEMTPSTTGQGSSTCVAPGSYHAFVALTGCNLVGEIDLTTGELVQALQLLPGGGSVVVDPATVSCPVECTGQSVDGGTPLPPTDGGTGPVDASVVSSDGGDGGLPPLLPPSAPQPKSLAIHPDINSHACPAGFCRQLFIADAVGDQLTVVDLDLTNDAFGAARVIPLEAPSGIDVVRISPRIFAPLIPTDFASTDLTSNDPNDKGIRYAFVTARDRTVRVVNAEDGGGECETNLDTAAVNQAVPIVERTGGIDTLGRDEYRVKTSPYQVQRDLRCVPVGDTTYPRHPLATHPGISLPGSALPRDVEFAHVDRPLAVIGGTFGIEAAPGLPVGDFAWIVDSSGRISAVTLFDRCVQPNIPELGKRQGQACDPSAFEPSVNDTAARPGFPVPLASDFLPTRLRAGNLRFFRTVNYTDAIGTPRLADLPLVTAEVPIDAPETAVHLCNFSMTSSLKTRTECAARPTVAPIANVLQFHDPSTTVAEGWSFEWEGQLPGTARSTGLIRTDGRLVDPGAVFCFRGVQAEDRLFVTGCGINADCALDQQCFIDPAAPIGGRGLCLSRDPVRFAEATRRCAPWTQSVRHYRIVEARATELLLDEVAAPENLNDTIECQNDADCEGLAMLGKQRDGTSRPLPMHCLADGRGKHCLVTCKKGVLDEDLCPASPASPTAPAGTALKYTCGHSRYGEDRCLRGEMLPTDPALQSLCFGEQLIYDVHAGDAFMVRGFSSGTFGGGFAGSDGKCALPSDDRGRLRQSRLPINPPDCPDSIKTLDWLGPVSQLPAGINSCKLAGGTPRCPADTILRYSNPVFDVVVVVPVTRFTLPGVDGGVPLDAGLQGLDGGGFIPPPDLGGVDLAGDGGFDAGPGVRIGTADGGLPLSCVPNMDFVRGESITLVPAQGTTLSFSTLIGAHPLTVTLFADVAAQLPRSARVGPDLKSIYVADEGKQVTASGLRGQIMRFLSDSQATDLTFFIR